MIRIVYSVKSQEAKKSRFFPQGMDEAKYLRRYIANYEYVNISSFAVLDIELRLEKEGDLHTYRLRFSFKFIQLKAQN